ncbi:asparagine synthase-related protein [Halorarius halobius]|uniref:asparagine synthase-related protein n=1 Tax=Halorarius halobius TaxID=2962671 RepID=UPI0020CE53C5|nr:asparagine synthetase B family protein [Halorarius halobius]
MVGIVGGTVSGSSLSSMVELLDREPWYDTERYERGDAGVALVSHGAKDPAGRDASAGDGAAGVLHGAITNRAALGLEGPALFRALVDRPSAVLPRADGPFLAAAVDDTGERLTLATDTLATRPGYYAETPGGIVFGSELKAVADRLPDPQLDEAAAGDLVSFGYVLGEKTLVEGVRALPPGSLLRYDDGEVSVRRYWSPELGRASVDGYVDDTVDRYRTAVDRTADTLDGRVGVWLSGGLDSRALAGVLREAYGPFRTITYDSNPSDGSNLAPAREVADHLGVENSVVEMRPGDPAETLGKAIDATDGMVAWHVVHNPGFVFDGLHDAVDVILEAAPQGELFGEDIWLHNMMDSATPAEAISRSFPHLSAEETRAVVDADVDPEASIADAVADSEKSTQANRVQDTWFRTFLSNSHFRGNRVYRSQVGMRVPFTDRAFLDHVGKMPHERFRQDTFPLSGGRVPRAMSPLKRDVIVALDDDLASIPYERTGVAPKRPLALHDAAYVLKHLKWQVTGRPVRWLDWYREDDRVRETIDDWLDRAAARPVLEADGVADLRDRLRDGDPGALAPVAGVTSLAVWTERYLD